MFLFSLFKIKLNLNLINYAQQPGSEEELWLRKMNLHGNRWNFFALLRGFNNYINELGRIRVYIYSTDLFDSQCVTEEHS